MRELFIDCSSGLAGDMLSAAIFELFDNKEVMLHRLNSFGIPGVLYTVETIKKYGISGARMKVEYRGEEETQDSFPCHWNHEHEKTFDETDEHRHSHNGLHEILHIIDHLKMAESVKNDVRSVYELIAKAESRVHGCNMENIHFHELGTMDAVADISAVCYMINELKPDKITASPLCTGYGKINCAHGIIPVPAPATALLLEGIPCFAGEIEGEMCTPTGVALVKHLADRFGQMPGLIVKAVGYGMGGKDFGSLTCTRVIFGESY